MSRKYDGVGPGSVGCAVVCLALWILALVIGVKNTSGSPKDDDPYRKGILDQQVYTAEVDRRKAAKLLAQGKRQEGEEYLSRAEEKLYRGQQEQADTVFLSKIQGEVGQVKTQHAAEIIPIRKRRAAERMKWKTEQTRAALRALEYRNRAWGQVLETVQDRLNRHRPGAESYVESPFRVDPAALRAALSRRYGRSYVEEAERLAPGTCESAVKDAEALAEQAAR